MRRFATLGLALMLAGCGYNTWWNPPFTPGYLPNAPTGDAENLLRAKGNTVDLPPLTPQAGDVWPGPVPPTPTLQELEQQGNLEMAPEQPVPGSPLSRGEAPQGQTPGQTPPSPPPRVSHGSSTPPGSNQPGLPPLPKQRTAVPPRGPASPTGPQPGQVVQTPSGPGVTTGGTQGYQTMTMPGGGSAIVVPNGNGTSTVIKSDGSIETIPTPQVRRMADTDRPLTILYFAWLRERVGMAAEELSLPPSVATVADLVELLVARGAGYAAAFANRRSVRCAVNQEFAPASTVLHPGDEVAFFPPVTGG